MIRTWISTGMFAATAILASTPASAVTVGSVDLSIAAPQYHLVLMGGVGGCDFVDPNRILPNGTIAGPKPGCQMVVGKNSKKDDRDGAYSSQPDPGSTVRKPTVLMENEYGAKKQKTLVLQLKFKAAAGVDAPGPGTNITNLPTLFVNYDDPTVKQPKNIPFAISWLKATDTWQFRWKIYEQPDSEEVELDTLKLSVGGVLTPYDSAWLEKLDFASHCPEPGSWAMMIAGFGLVGGAMRKSRSTLTVL